MDKRLAKSLSGAIYNFRQNKDFSPGVGDGNKKARMEGRRILVVDDERDHCFFMEEYLTKRGYSVDVAYDGRKASELLESNEYESVLFDCNMPELSGIELVAIIDEKNPKAKKIMISAYDGIDEHFAGKLGVDTFMTKPFPLEVLEKAIEGERS